MAEEEKHDQGGGGGAAAGGEPAVRIVGFATCMGASAPAPAAAPGEALALRRAASFAEGGGVTSPLSRALREEGVNTPPQLRGALLRDSSFDERGDDSEAGRHRDSSDEEHSTRRREEHACRSMPVAIPGALWRRCVPRPRSPISRQPA